MPEGKLVVIIPKTVTIGNGIYNYSIGFTYPPSDYSKDEINQIRVQYLYELGLDESEAHIVELDVLMDIWGKPSIYDPNHGLSFSRGDDRLHISPSGLTIWKMRFHSNEDIGGGLHYVRVGFNYANQSLNCKEICEEIGEPYLDPSEDVEVRINYPISARIYYAWIRIDNFWAKLIRRWWFKPVLFYTSLVLATFLFEIIMKVRNQQPPK